MPAFGLISCIAESAYVPSITKGVKKMPIVATAKTTTFQLNTQVGDTNESYTVTFAYCKDFDGDDY